MALVKARVKPGNKYGPHPEGSVIEVEESELAECPWCLELVAEEPKRGGLVEKAAKVPPLPDDVLEDELIEEALDFEEEETPPPDELAPKRKSKLPATKKKK